MFSLGGLSSILLRVSWKSWFGFVMGMIAKGYSKTAPFKTKRTQKIRPAHLKLIKRHKRQIGEIVYHWNAAQGALFHVFWALLGSEHEAALGMWHSIQNDTTQRNLLKNLSKDAKTHTKSLRKSIIWACSMMDDLAVQRNIATHVQVIPFDNEILANTSTSRPSAVRRTQVNSTDSIWRDLRGDLIALENYSGGLMLDVFAKSARPSHHRPTLKCAPAKKLATRPKRRANGKSKLQPQPQSSPE